jgi:hypothetical protein
MSPPAEVTSNGHKGRYPDVAYNSNFDEYLVVWKGYKEIWGRRVSSRGEPLGTEFQIATGPTAGDGGPKVAYDAWRNRYLVVWGRWAEGGLAYHMYGRFITWNGPSASWPAFVIDTSRPARTPYYYAVAHAYTQDEYLVVWPARPSASAPLAVTGRRVKADGSGFAGGPFWITSHTSDNRQNPDVAYNLYRNEYLVVCDDYSKVNEDIYGVRLAGTGTVLGGGEFVIAGWPGDELEPAVAACHTEDQYLAAWHGQQIAEGTGGIYARLMSGTGTSSIVKNIVHYSWLENHMPVDVACGVTDLPTEDPRYLVVWTGGDYLGGEPIYAQEVSTIGTMSEQVRVGDGGLASVAGGGHNYLVAWEATNVWDNTFPIIARIVGNTAPRAAFTISPAVGDSTTVFQFDASTCTDATDSLEQLAVRWDWEGDGTYDTSWSQNKISIHRYSLEPWDWEVVYRAWVEVTDGHGTSGRTYREVTVQNAPAAAAFTVTPTSGDTKTAFQFDASGSSDPEGGVLGARWDWEDDGTYDTGWSFDLTAAHTFPVPGTYTVRVQVQDNWGKADTATGTVTVGQSATRELVYLPVVVRKAP